MPKRKMQTGTSHLLEFEESIERLINDPIQFVSMNVVNSASGSFQGVSPLTARRLRDAKRFTDFPGTVQSLLRFPGIVLFVVDLGMIF
jgi:hypothetical protein